MDWFAIVPTLCIGFAVVRLTAVCQSFLPYVFLPVPGFVVAVFFLFRSDSLYLSSLAVFRILSLLAVRFPSSLLSL